MYPNLIFYDWLDQLKINLAIADNGRDEVLLTYLEIAHKNVWTQYMGQKLVNNAVPEEHPLAYDKRVGMGTIHLACSYFSNPDDTKQGSNVIDKRTIYRLLGELVNYG